MKGESIVRAMLAKIANTIKPVEAFVICCNDNPEYVHLGTMDKAKEKLEELAKEYYDHNHFEHRFSRYKDYRVRYFWHIRTVNYGID